MSTSVRISLHSFILHGFTFLLGLVAAWKHIATPSLGGMKPVEFTTSNSIIFFLVFFAFTFITVRFIRVAQFSLSIVLAIALAAGAHYILSSWTGAVPAFIGVVVLVGMTYILPLVIVHDIAIIAGIAGIAAVLGSSLTPLMACILLAVLSVYDIISVYRTRHMVVLAERMMASGAVFGFLVPARVSGFFQTRRSAMEAKSVMMLGSGDIGLPLVLAVSAVSTSIGMSVMISAFALVGLLAMNWLFAHQKHSAPMAALPPIALSAILGYAVSILLNI